MVATAAAAACRTFSSLSAKLPSGDLSSKSASLFRTSWLTLWLSVAIASRRAFGVRAVQRGERQARGDFLLDAGIGFHGAAARAAAPRSASSSDCDISRTASNRTDASGLDNEKCATVVLNVLLKPLFVPILVRLSAGADPASFSDSGSIRLRGSASADLTIKTF